VSDNSWTWIAGSDTGNQVGVYGDKGVADESNVPGSRVGAVVWVDSVKEELWLFGGNGVDGYNKTGM